MTDLLPARPRPSAAAGPADSYPRRWAALAVLCVSLLVVNLDNTILNVALPTLVRDLHATTGQLQWIVDAYALVFAGLLLVGGSLGDRLGRKPVLLAGLTIFGIGSAASAFAGSVHPLVAARASMGVGGALIMPCTLSLITAMFRDPAERTKAIGLWAATSGLGIAIGPVVGGLLLSRFWWGSVFLVNVPVIAVGALATVRLVPNSKDPHAAAPDPVGAALSVLGLGLLLWGVIEAPTHGWSSATVVGCLVTAGVVLAAFVWWESRCTHPMLRLEFFRRRRFSVATGTVGLVMFGLFGAMFCLTQLLQFVLGFSPVQAGIRILPVAALLAAAAPVSALVVRRWGTKLPVTTGLLSIAAGLAWLAQTPTLDPSYARALPGMLLLGLGAGLTIPPAVDSLMGAVPVELGGVGSATNGVSLQVGGALGVAVLGSLLAIRYQAHLLPVLATHPVPEPARQAILGSVGGAMGVAHVVGGPTGAGLSTLAGAAFVDGMDLALTVGAAVALTSAALAAALLPARPAAHDRRRPGTDCRERGTDRPERQ